jgi:hypothetical protein
MHVKALVYLHNGPVFVCELCKGIDAAAEAGLHRRGYGEEGKGEDRDNHDDPEHYFLVFSKKFKGHPKDLPIEVRSNKSSAKVSIKNPAGTKGNDYKAYPITIKAFLREPMPFFKRLSIPQ